MKTLRDRLVKDFGDKEARQQYGESHLFASIALQIKALRQQRGWTQAELADRAGMKQSRISAMEQTSYQSWSIQTLKRLADAFDLPLLVKFESWGKLVDDASSLNRKSLERPEFQADPALGLAEPESGHTATYVVRVPGAERVEAFHRGRARSSGSGASDNVILARPWPQEMAHG